MSFYQVANMMTLMATANSTSSTQPCLVKYYKKCNNNSHDTKDWKRCSKVNKLNLGYSSLASNKNQVTCGTGNTPSSK